MHSDCYLVKLINISLNRKGRKGMNIIGRYLPGITVILGDSVYWWYSIPLSCSPFIPSCPPVPTTLLLLILFLKLGWNDPVAALCWAKYETLFPITSKKDYGYFEKAGFVFVFAKTKIVQRRTAIFSIWADQKLKIKPFTAVQRWLDWTPQMQLLPCTGEVTVRDILAPFGSLIHIRLLGQGRLT